MFKSIRVPLWGREARRGGFTLIELLIVIAIILILIAIALPNFLEAQERARVTRAKAHLKTMETAIYSHVLQYGFLYSDYNDPFTVTRKTRNKNSPQANLPCPIFAGAILSKGGLDYLPSASQSTYYAPNMHCPLTTPIKYMDAASTVDPWSDGSVPVGMDSYYEAPGGDDPKFIHYSAYFVSGPDRINGHWHRGHEAFNTKCTANLTGWGTEYTPTNGTTSCGDLWMVIANNSAVAKSHYRNLRTF